MLAAVLLVNPKGSYITRPLVKLTKEKTTEVIETFLQHKSKTKDTKGILTTKIGSYFYQEIDDVFLAVLADKEDLQVFRGIKLLELAVKSITKLLTLDTYSHEIADLINAIDEIFTKEGVINRTPEELTKVLTFQSNDESLHQMIQKNKEKEQEKAQRMQKKVHPAIDELAKEIEQIKLLKNDLKTSAEAAPPKKKQTTKTKDFMDSLDSPINILALQRLTSQINSTTEVSKTEGTGELLIKITEEDHTDIKINIQSKPATTRVHPSVDRKAFSNNQIVPKAEIPTNRTLTFLKWAVEAPVLPIEVLFWQNEMSEERYRFFIEVTAITSDIKYIQVRVPIKRVSDIELTTGTIQNDTIIAEIHNLKKEETSAIEFSGLCDNTDTLFPFHLTYTIEQPNTLAPIVLSSILSSSTEVPLSQVSCMAVTEGECTITMDSTNS